MGFRLFHRVRIIPGLRLNLSKTGVSASIGTRGAWFTIGRKGTRTTVGLPGTGLYWTEASWKRHRALTRSGGSPPRSNISEGDNPPRLPPDMPWGSDTAGGDPTLPDLKAAAAALAVFGRKTSTYDEKMDAAYTFAAYTSAAGEKARNGLWALFFAYKETYGTDATDAMEKLSAFTASEVLPRVGAPNPPAIIDEPEYSVDRLATMNFVEYDLHRRRAAKALGLRVSVLDKVVKAAQANRPRRGGRGWIIFLAFLGILWAVGKCGAPSIHSVSSSSPVSDAPSASTTAAPAAVPATVPHDPGSDNADVAAGPSPPVAAAPVLSAQVDCTNIQDRVFDTPEEAGQARAACGLKPQAVMPFSPSKDRLYRAQSPAPIPQTHHGRN